MAKLFSRVAFDDAAGVSFLDRINGQSVGSDDAGASFHPLLYPIAEGQLANADATIVVTTASQFTLAAGTLTTNRTLTLGTAGAVTGEVIRVVRLDKTAFTLAVVNGGSGAGTLITLPVSVGRIADFVFDGTNWALSGVVRLA